MKTCVVRRRFYAAEPKTTLDVDLEPGFGIPKGAVIYFMENSANTDAFDTTLGFRNYGVGFIGSGTTTCINFTLQDAAATTATARGHSTTNLISATSSDRATVYYRCTGATFLTDKIRFTFTNQATQTNGHLDTLIWAITGDDVTVGVGSSSFSATNGTTRVYSGLSFQPDFVLIASNNTIANQSLSADATFSLGVATRLPFKQSGIGWSYANGLTTTASGCRVSDAAITQLINQAAATTCAISNITTGGWTMTTTGTLATNTVYNFFAIQSQSPTDFAILDFNTPTATGITFTGLGSTGFVAGTILGANSFVQTRNALQTTSATGADGFGLFAGTANTFTKLFNGDGTITYSTASTTVTGAGSTFWKFANGYRLYTIDGSLIGTVSSIASTTSLTLTAVANSNGTAVNYTYSFPRQGTLSIGDNDGTVGSLVYSHTSSQAYTVCEGTPSVLVQGYLDDPDSRPGFEFNFPVTNAAATFGWLAAFKNQTTSRRRGSVS